MIKKTIVVIAASALACGLWASAASAKTTKPKKAKPAAVAKVEPMKPVPGNNPFTVAAKRDVPKNVQKPEAIKGNNAMGVATK
jgi:hypothetical protein